MGLWLKSDYPRLFHDNLAEKPHHNRNHPRAFSSTAIHAQNQPLVNDMPTSRRHTLRTLASFHWLKPIFQRSRSLTRLPLPNASCPRHQSHKLRNHPIELSSIRKSALWSLSRVVDPVLTPALSHPLFPGRVVTRLQHHH